MYNCCQLLLQTHWHAQSFGIMVAYLTALLLSEVAKESPRDKHWISAQITSRGRLKCISGQNYQTNGPVFWSASLTTFWNPHNLITIWKWPELRGVQPPQNNHNGVRERVADSWQLILINLNIYLKTWIYSKTFYKYHSADFEDALVLTGFSNTDLS